MKFTSRGKWVVYVASIIFFLGLVGIVVFCLTNVNEKYTTDSTTTIKTSYIECMSDNVSDAFFESNTANSSSHRIYVIFDDKNYVNKISYTYTGNYDAEKQSEDDRILFGIKFDRELERIGLKKSDITSNFSASNNTTTVTLYSEKSGLNIDIAKFFFIDNVGNTSIDRLSKEKIKKIYYTKGFDCKESE